MAEYNVFMSGSVSSSSVADFSLSEVLNINFKIDTASPPGPGNPDLHLSHPDALSAFEFFSNNHTIQSLPGYHSAEVHNEMTAASQVGDFFDLVFGGGAIPFDGLLKIGSSDPASAHTILNSANLHDAVLALESFNSKEFILLRQSGEVTGNITSLSVLPVAGIPGDFDRNGVVNGADLDIWKGEFGKQGIIRADGDQDMDSDGRDFLIWQRNFGNTEAVSGLSASNNDFNSTQVPEPSAGGLLLSSALLFTGFMRRYFK